MPTCKATDYRKRVREVDAFDRREGGDGAQRRLGGRDRVAGFSTLSCTWSYGGCRALAPCPETWI